MDEKQYTVLQINSAESLRQWLRQNHAKANGVWITVVKSDQTSSPPSYSDILNEALCFGWVNGVRSRPDAKTFARLLVPWSNHAWTQARKDRAAKLIASGRMRAPGRAVIEKSLRLGLWQTPLENAEPTLDEDLLKLLTSVSGAMDGFLAFRPFYRWNVLRWLNASRTPTTRNRRLRMILFYSARGQKIPQF